MVSGRELGGNNYRLLTDHSLLTTAHVPLVIALLLSVSSLVAGDWRQCAGGFMVYPVNHPAPTPFRVTEYGRESMAAGSLESSAAATRPTDAISATLAGRQLRRLDRPISEL